MKTSKRITRKHYSLFIIHYSFVLFFVAAATLPAAEIRFKGEPVRCTETLVTLAEIADITPAPGDDVQRLRQTVVTTAPAFGEEKTLGSVEVRDILSRAGVSSLHHRISGAGRITLVGGNVTKNTSPIVQAAYTYESVAPVGIQTASATLPATESSRSNMLRRMPISPQLVRTLEQQVGEAIGVYLNYRYSAETGKRENLPWKVTVKLSQEQGRLLASSGQIVDILGNDVIVPESSIGTLRFGIRMQAADPTTGQNTVVTVDAQVTLPQEVVVVRRSLPKGFIIGPNDVMLRRVEQVKGEEFFVDVKDVIGRETVKAVSETGVLTPAMLRKPTWVRKGDIVTIWAINGGIRVRNEVMALADGCEGDTIPVETINPNAAKRGRRAASDAASFLARVCEPKTVEVYATGKLVNE